MASNKLDSVMSKLNELKARIKVNEGESTTFKNELARIIASIRGTFKPIQDSIKRCSTLTAEIKRLTDELAALQQKYQLLEDENNKLKSDLQKRESDLLAQIDQLTRELDEQIEAIKRMTASTAFQEELAALQQLEKDMKDISNGGPGSGGPGSGSGGPGSGGPGSGSGGPGSGGPGSGSGGPGSGSGRPPFGEFDEDDDDDYVANIPESYFKGTGRQVPENFGDTDEIPPPSPEVKYKYNGGKSRRIRRNKKMMKKKTVKRKKNRKTNNKKIKGGWIPKKKNKTRKHSSLAKSTSTANSSSQLSSSSPLGKSSKSVIIF